MKKIVLGFSFIFALLSVGDAYSNTNFWEPVPLSEQPVNQSPTSETSEYDLYKISTSALKAKLFHAGTSAEKGVEIELPYVNGELTTFVVWETPMMEKGLQAMLPHVKTYTAHAKNDHGITAKLDFTSFGFRAAIYSPTSTYLINPYTDKEDLGLYILFDQKSLKNLSPINCTADQFISNLDLPQTNQLLSSRMGIKSVYRIAITTTGEYAQLVTVNSTVNQTLEVIISTLNRVNGVYERELAVSFNLIANNDQVIYTNPTSDPYSCNMDASCLIDEGASVLNNIIGNTNFDIGHIFNTAGGGLAALNSLCDPQTKGMGVSSSSGPDDYFVILHEIGHQVGANHVFSSAAGGCDGNGNPNTNYEPGSGSTIMSYAGVCAEDNIQGVSDNYFNGFSLQEMSAHLSGGGNCGVNTPVNTTITFDSEEESYNVPIFTPYELSSPEATGPHQDAVLLYNWEQYENGNYGDDESNGSEAEEGPLFKSQAPSEQRTRIYPKSNFILDDSYSGPGERLSNVAREVIFRPTVRSIFQGLGGYKSSENETTIIVASNPKFRVTGPSNNETWEPGDVKTITWDAGGSNDSPVSSGYVSIYLSLDDGETFPFLIVSNAPNTGSYDYTVHDIGTTKGRIKVQGSGNVFFDIGKGKLNITGNPANNINEMSKQAPIVAFPNPVSDYLLIDRKDGIFGPIEIEVYNILGQKIAQQTMNGGQLKINTQSWSNGHYIIQTLDANGQRNHIKILK